AAKADGRWEMAYAGQADAEVPADLAAAVAAGSEAQAMFEVLTSVNRYALYYRLNALRTPAARERKIAEFVQMLARHEAPHPQQKKPWRLPARCGRTRPPGRVRRGRPRPRRWRAGSAPSRAWPRWRSSAGW
ncbi:hypothetical protein HER39_16725, partial [Arthrobacter deserti]|nr:hypothetical protein [Arthrobacter deserti]